MEIKYFVYETHFKEEFSTSYGSRRFQKSVILSIKFGDYVGYGECVESKLYGMTIEQHLRDITYAMAWLASLQEIPYPVEVWGHLKNLLPSNSFVLCGLDQALWDLWAKKKGMPLWECLGLNKQKSIPSSYTISLANVEQMIKQLQQEPGWSVYKIKLGVAADSSKIIKHLRHHVDARFIVDANCAWTGEECLHYANELHHCGVEIIEQPLAHDQWEAMRGIYSASTIPIFADESCINPEDVEKCHGHFHGINIKLMKCGGITPALKMIEYASLCNMQIMLGCIGGETSVSISAAAHLLPLVDFADIDGAYLLLDDPADGIILNKGHCIFTDLAGTGAVMKNTEWMSRGKCN